MDTRHLPITLAPVLVALGGCQTTSAPADASGKAVADTNSVGTLTLRGTVSSEDVSEKRSTKQEETDAANRAADSSRTGNDEADSDARDDSDDGNDGRASRGAGDRANPRVIAGRQAAQQRAGGQDRAGGDAMGPEGAAVLDSEALDDSFEFEMGPPMETADDYYATLEVRVQVRLANTEDDLTISQRAQLDSELQSMTRQESPADLPRERVGIPTDAESPELCSSQYPFLKGINGKPRTLIDWKKWQRVRQCARDAELGGFAPRP